jgi:cell wall-associated NlpC family hydrolase
MWQNNYVGIPYKHYGRDKSGIDCWGLACLIYKEQFGIELPSFSEPSTYEAGNRAQIAEIFAQNMEGWTPATHIVPGTIAVFRILGQPSHIGIAVSSTHFIHAMEGHSCAVEAFDSINWANRLVGTYNYTSKASGYNLVAIPHPLRTERIMLNVAYGSTIQQVFDTVTQQENISELLKARVTILKNGKVVPRAEWNNVTVQHGDTLQYRAVPGEDVARLVLTLVVIYVAVTIAGPAAAGSASLQSALGISAAQASSLAVGATIAAGTLLVNAIMPIRPPSQPDDPGSAKSQLIISGATNKANPYGAIPFVLGKMRITPPLGAQSFARFGQLTSGIVDAADKSYLDMLLVWGYGPLDIDETSMRIGEIPLRDYSVSPSVPNFTKMRYITLDRKLSESLSEQIEFNSIYGSDIQQRFSGVPLTCPGLPPVSESNSFNRTVPWVPASQPGINIEAGFANPCDKISVALHFPQGLRAIIVKGEQAGKAIAAPVKIKFEFRTASVAGWVHWTTETIGGTLADAETVTIDTGDLDNPSTTTIELPANRIVGGAPRKDAFTWTITKDRLTNGVAAWSATEPLQVRVTRLTGDETEPDDTYRYIHAVILQTVTAISNNRPAIDPKNCKIAKTAFSIQATDQLNNQIDGINALVQTWCLDWNGTSWEYAATSNPASLFRYVLQSAANPQPILDSEIDTKLDLAQLEYWHEFCSQVRSDPVTGKTYKYEFNDVVAAPRSVLEVLRDICAAGKGSPALINGKWTVVIDEPKDTVVQHFSPHNSWGFESTKILPKFPDAIKVQYNDEEFDYQQREIIIPYAGKSVQTSELFETIQLPGVTNQSLARDHARWHMAQTKLRPEIYTLNSDLEYLVCNRGDRVKVSHDIPMWGLGSGRVSRVISEIQIELDEQLSLRATQRYTIRFRTNTGSSVVREIQPVLTDGYFNIVTLLEPLEYVDPESETMLEVNAGDLFLFGKLDEEAQDLLVIDIEPGPNKVARITLVDYGVVPGNYNIYTDYLTLSSDVIFDSQVTLPTKLLLNSFGTKIPTITNAVSDETVMEVTARGVYSYKLVLSFTNAENLPETTSNIQAQIDYAAAVDDMGVRSSFIEYTKGSIEFTNVDEGEEYRVRLRYTGSDGRTGNWTQWYNHTIVGKNTPPSVVTGIKYEVNQNSGKIVLSWDNNPELDIVGYEVRYTDSNWGINDLYVYKGTNSLVEVDPVVLSTDISWFIRAYDANGNYSTSSVSVDFELTTPAPIDGSLVTHSFADTSLTSATVTLSWQKATQTLFAISGYKIKYDSTEVFVNATTITFLADWVGTRTFTITSVDILGLESSEAQVPIPKLAPNPVPFETYRAQVIDNNVLLYWDLPAKTTLPISHVLLRKTKIIEGITEYTWDTAENVGEKSGTFTSFSELERGEYIYWIRTVDTDGVQSTERKIQRRVAQPPDYIYNREFTTNFTDSSVELVNVAVNTANNSLIMPVNNVEQWQQHYTNNGWNTPLNQIQASFPYYPQPGEATAYYSEIFDYGTLLASSQLTLEAVTTVISGSGKINYYLSYSQDGNTYSVRQLTNNLFALNFRFVKVEIEMTEDSIDTLIELSAVVLTLDSKSIGDSGNVIALEEDTNGTIVNFSKEFVDVSSITVSVNAASNSQSVLEYVSCIYDFKDAVRLSDYSIVSNTCTMLCSNHGFYVGQNVRLTFRSGTAPNGVYPITNVLDNNTFTCTIPTTNTSGEVYIYPNSLTVYVFNNSGQRRTRQVSWQLQGF